MIITNCAPKFSPKISLILKSVRINQQCLNFKSNPHIKSNAIPFTICANKKAAKKSHEVM